jgi:hypothetical protein
VSETSARDTTHPQNRPHPDSPPTPSPPSPSERTSAHPPAPPPLIADADGLQASIARTRLCILCGGPLRAGQHMLRVHGSTIHARCSSSR